MLAAVVGAQHGALRAGDPGGRTADGRQAAEAGGAAAVLEPPAGVRGGERCRRQPAPGPGRAPSRRRPYTGSCRRPSPWGCSSAGPRPRSLPPPRRGPAPAVRVARRPAPGGRAPLRPSSRAPTQQTSRASHFAPPRSGFGLEASPARPPRPDRRAPRPTTALAATPTTAPTSRSARTPNPPDAPSVSHDGLHHGAPTRLTGRKPDGRQVEPPSPNTSAERTAKRAYAYIQRPVTQVTQESNAPGRDGPTRPSGQRLNEPHRMQGSRRCPASSTKPFRPVSSRPLPGRR